MVGRSTQLYAIIGAGWPPSGLQRTSWQEGWYSIEPRVSIKASGFWMTA